MSTEFKAAAEQVKKLKTAPTNDEKLELYGLFKQGTNDPTFEKAAKPGVFDLTGKAKYNAWKKVVDDGKTPEQAQKEYVELVEKLKNQYGFEA